MHEIWRRDQGLIRDERVEGSKRDQGCYELGAKLTILVREQGFFSFGASTTILFLLNFSCFVLES